MNEYLDKALDVGIDVGKMIVGALLLWIIGRMVIRMVTRIVNGMLKERLDSTVARYLGSALDILLNILLFIAVLSVFGVETTTFAGLLAAGGVAIGMAWSGLLGNFAAGVFLLVLRPFKVGDFVTIGGQTGTVTDIGMFVTSIDTLDNVRVFIGNGQVLGGVIQNFSANPYRRVDLFAQLNHGDDANQAMEILREAIAKIPNVESKPAPDVFILEFNLAGPKLCVRPYTNNDHYWQVYFDTNAAIRTELGKAGFKIPEEHLVISQRPAA
ncbi:mechanosensitive ion channel family protein [Paraliomyxa miuraensis]|uniref:mechanosensitive ion channel family protein n=1 Tax=Paraliomyxa miuraensis TaxID=376150 RepID=UPI002250C764|nr:mechanosensitive ion channel family protein [Paraliomyxa miuraensis]MCX4244456.1 mechanosensitive ion channel family protein [Paraliomyxa miuraensis]